MPKNFSSFFAIRDAVINGRFISNTTLVGVHSVSSPRGLSA
jgi:hypothetical protein